MKLYILRDADLDDQPCRGDEIHTIIASTDPLHIVEKIYEMGIEFECEYTVIECDVDASGMIHRVDTISTDWFVDNWEQTMEVYEGVERGDIAAVVLDAQGNVMAICYPINGRDDIPKMRHQLKDDSRAYLGWTDCFYASNINSLTFVEKHDADGNEIDLKEHPWTLQELYNDVRSYSEMIYVG